MNKTNKKFNIVCLIKYEPKIEFGFIIVQIS